MDQPSLRRTKAPDPQLRDNALYPSLSNLDCLTRHFLGHIHINEMELRGLLVEGKIHHSMGPLTLGGISLCTLMPTKPAQLSLPSRGAGKQKPQHKNTKKGCGGPPTERQPEGQTYYPTRTARNTTSPPAHSLTRGRKS